jgi:hypothetical protein
LVWQFVWEKYTVQQFSGPETGRNLFFSCWCGAASADEDRTEIAPVGANVGEPRAIVGVVEPSVSDMLVDEARRIRRAP